MKRPWLVQRCKLKDGKLSYDYMGSAEFEIGGQAKSLKRIFESGMLSGVALVRVEDKDIGVHILAIKDFDLRGYDPYLQQIADNILPLKERTYFKEAVKAKAGVPTDYPRTVNVWFDFENDILWTLSQANYMALASALEISHRSE